MAANLTIRAERALLGAMITDPHLASNLTVEPADFSLHVHSRLFDAIMHVDMAADLSAGTRRRQVIAAVGQPQIHEHHLDMLTRQCPEPDHGPVYARLVQEAAVRRIIAAHADRLGQQASSLGYDARRLIRTAGEQGFEPENLSLHIAKVATALRWYADAFDPATAPVLSGPAHPADLGDLLHSPKFWATASHAWGNAATRLAARYACEQAEEQMLTALLHDHPGSGHVLDMLSATEFTDPGRQRIFTAIRELRHRDHPVDPLITDWEIARHQASGSATAIPDASWTLARTTRDSYVTRLGQASIDPARSLSAISDAVVSKRYRLGDFMPRGVLTGIPRDSQRPDQFPSRPHLGPAMHPPPAGDPEPPGPKLLP